MRAKLLFLLPLIVVQAIWVAARATRLPEPAGAREGRAGAGPLLRLLIVGDSSAAGVGAATQDQALTGQLVADLSRDHSVAWRLVAKSGATAASTLRELRRADRQRFDIVVIVLGVNDSKNGVSLTAWRRNCTRLLDHLEDHVGAERIMLCALPPLGRFPLLPAPLRQVLGARAARLDAELSRIATTRKNAQHLSPDILLDPEQMAADGFHPGPRLYATWACSLAEAIRGNAAPRTPLPKE